MKVKEKQYDVGVLVGRFQVPELHEAHKALIGHVVSEHDKVLIVLGVSPLWVTRENPLDFEARKQMILAEFPKVTCAYIKDVNNDTVWSKRLDGLVRDFCTPAQSAVLYGGRESFIEHYDGAFPTRELLQDVWMSGKSIRQQIQRSSALATPDFRAGVVWAAFSRFPIAFPTVDVAIWNQDRDRLLLGRKAVEKQFRFIGGFATPESESYEQDARREVHEEAGIEITDPIYLGSFKVDDWRYRREVDKIKTVLFDATYFSGRPTPGDDIEEVRWFDIDGLKPTDVVETHWPLLEKARASR